MAFQIEDAGAFQFDAQAIAASVRRWNEHMEILEGRLSAAGAYVVGATFTLADVVIGLSTHRWFVAPIERPNLPAVGAYYERLSERPAFVLHGRNSMP